MKMNDARNGSIHSGHFMTSYVHDQNEETVLFNLFCNQLE